jgi:hypothetical protein
MNSFLAITKDKNIFIHLDCIIEHGRLIISNKFHEIVLEKEIIKSDYEVINLNQKAGKYNIRIESDSFKSRKSIIIK